MTVIRPNPSQLHLYQRTPTPSTAGYEGDPNRSRHYSARSHQHMDGGPRVISAMAIAAPHLAQGLNQWSNVFEQQEKEKQTIEALKETEAFQDTQRSYLAAMSQMEGADGYAAPQFMEKFYEKEGKKLLGKARGDFQRQQYEKFITANRDMGLNLAVNHRLKAHGVYKNQVYTGLQAKVDEMIMADPGNFDIYTAKKIATFREFNKSAAPEWIAAQSNAIAGGDYMKAFEGAVASGNGDLARDIMKRAFEAKPFSASTRPTTLPQGAEPYMGLVHEAAETYGVPANVIVAVMQTESAFKAGAVSPTGVKGLMQVTQKTYNGLGFTGDRSDPYNSVMAGTKLLSQLYQRYGNWDDAFADYNGGPDAVRGLRSGNWGTWTGKAAKQREIRDYAPTVNRHLKTMGALVAEEGAGGDSSPQQVMLASLGAPPVGMGAPAQTDESAIEFVDDPLKQGAATETPDANGNIPAAVMPAGYGGLVPPKQLFAMQSAYNKMINAQTKEVEVEQKRLGNEIQKDMTIKWYSTEGLSQGDVVAVRDYLSPDDFDKYMARARDGVPPPSHSDREMLIQAREMAGSRDPNFQDTIDIGLRLQRLTVADYNSLSSLGEKTRAPIYKQAEQVIRLKTGRSEMNPNPAADLSYLQAMEDFDEWLDSDAGQKTSDRERMEMANRIGDNYRLVNLENNLLGVPAPLFLVGSRTTPDIASTAKATKAAYEAGRISETQYNDECVRIKRMADILQQQGVTDTSRTDRSNR